MPVFHFMAALFLNGVILLTYYIPQYQTLLLDLTKEEGLYETATVLFFLATALLALYAVLRKKHYSFERPHLAILLCVSALSFVAALEEISWGQRTFGLEPGDFFRSYNIQEEINIHNFLPGVVFNTIVFTIIYSLFIVLPLLVMFFNGAGYFVPVADYVPRLDIVLLFLFGLSVHNYRPQYLVEYLNIAMSIICLIALGYLVFFRRLGNGVGTAINYLLLVFSVFIFWIHGEILGNGQSGGSDEIFEFVLSYAFFFWLYDWSKRHLVSAPMAH